VSAIASTAALLEDVFPGSAVGQVEYLRWLYQGSPFGEVIEANLDDELGRAGHYALVPIKLARDGRDIPGALSLNTAVHERARGGGTFVRLAELAIADARSRGVRAVVGVANASSTPGFLRRLGFELLAPLPARILLPTPGSGAGFQSAWADLGALAGDRLMQGAEQMLAPPETGEARLWNVETLKWRLSRPAARYAVHRAEDVLAVSRAERRSGVRVAVLLKVLARRELGARERGALVRAACRFHRAPLALHVGLNRNVSFPGLPLPDRLRASPLNLIYRSLEEPLRPGSIVDFEFLDFDAY
jgi:GNAT superfamily N-acetyltransferase